MIRLATIALATAFAAGCSFLLDFPSEQGGALPTGGNAAGGGGATGGMGGIGGTGGGGGPPSLVEELVWQGVPYEPSAGATVRTSALVKVPSLLYMFGLTSRGLDQFDIPLTTGSQVFVVEFRDDDQPPALTLYGGACDANMREPITRRMVRLDDDRSLVYALTVPTYPAHPTTSWGFGHFDNVCGTVGEVSIEAAPDNLSSDVPITGAYFDMLAVGQPFGPSDGVAFDTDLQSEGPDGPNRAVFFGAGEGTFDGEPVSDASYFIRVGDSGQNPASITRVLHDLYANTDEPHASWSGAAALDPDHVSWFTGGSCEAPGGCLDPQVFFGRDRLQPVGPTILVERPGGVSCGTSLEVFDGLVVVAGRYEGSLQFLGATLPDSDATVPFVIAVDASNDQVVWSYPNDTATPNPDPSRWQSVVDLAGLGTRSDDGAVYVLGCSVPASAVVFDCASFEPGKTGFLTKLEMATGAELWTRRIELASPSTDLFIPTAMTATGDRVWVAATFHGTVDAFGQPLTSGVSRETAVLRMFP